MADDLDVEALLEAPYRKEEVNGAGSLHQASSSGEGTKGSADKENRHGSSSKKRRSRSRSRSRGHGRHRSRSRGRDKRRSRSRSRERRRRRSRSPGRRRGPPLPPRPRSRSRSRDRRRRRSISPRRRGLDDITPEERDMRTVFCMQLSQRIRARDLEEFFSSVGKVRDVRLIMDNKTRRSKGIAYVEFQDVESVPLAMGLNGQKLFGIPIVVQPTQAERNRAAAQSASTSNSTLQRGNVGPMRLYVGSLHFNITEEMLKGIFEPFGKIDKIELIKDMETNRSKGYGFITFHDSEDAKKALEQLNGFELAGRPMKVGHVTERTDVSQAPSFLDSEELDRSGIDLGATGRLQLMAKLAEGSRKAACFLSAAFDVMSNTWQNATPHAPLSYRDRPFRLISARAALIIPACAILHAGQMYDAQVMLPTCSSRGTWQRRPYNGPYNSYRNKKSSLY
ncbi:RNA-binding protein 39-like protein Caper isoform X1 [Rhipicephalus microplus]|uniref:RNA-binding protein 39-like protein Caper isoform X1 n=1 Tax=Rhipicephalus microplus TaxID=6941 RepID=UPI003F6D8C97